MALCSCLSECKNKILLHFTLILLYIAVSSLFAIGKAELPHLSANEIANRVDRVCVVAVSSQTYHGNRLLFESIATAFREENSVVIATLDVDSLVWAPGKPLEFRDGRTSADAVSTFALFPKSVTDRTCLLAGNARRFPIADVFTGVLDLHHAVTFINNKCNTFRTTVGGTTVEGLHRKEILNTLFGVKDFSGTNMAMLYRLDNVTSCSIDSCFNDDEKQPKIPSLSLYRTKNEINDPGQMFQCDRISLPTRNEFFHNYLKISKPVIIKGAMKNWKAMTKWTNDFFRKHYGDRKIHVKLTPSGDYEGVEEARLFENYNSFQIPAHVKKQLKYPDLVVVRPATANMKFAKFLDIVESVARKEIQNMSAYLEYSSIASIMPDLKEDVSEMSFFGKMLKLEHSNIWLSDGNTLGRLHFDPFDNFLCQISGRKQVILFDPHDNSRLYEAHIPEAKLSYNPNSRTFGRKQLVDSTSMVMSPVDLQQPDFQRFPRLADAYPMNCTISEGEVLFMPSFWWHEVQSYPNTEQGRNLAVNFWYDPFLTKEFPCPDCKLDVNPRYHHLL